MAHPAFVALVDGMHIACSYRGKQIIKQTSKAEPEMGTALLPNVDTAGSQRQTSS
jgi:hypothetical protein